MFAHQKTADVITLKLRSIIRWLPKSIQMGILPAALLHPFGSNSLIAPVFFYRQ